MGREEATPAVAGAGSTAAGRIRSSGSVASDGTVVSTACVAAGNVVGAAARGSITRRCRCAQPPNASATQMNPTSPATRINAF